MTTTLVGWSREERHEELVQKLTRYKQRVGLDQPIFHDGDQAGEKKPLTACTLRVATDGTGRIVQPYPVRPDTDPTELADTIFAECYGHGKNYHLAGIAPTYVLQFHFNNERQPAGEFPIEVIEERRNELGSNTTAMVDLRDRKNQEAVLVTHVLQHGTRKDELFVGAMGELAHGYRDLLMSQREFTNQVMAHAGRLETDNHLMRSRERQVITDAIDNEIKRDNHKVMVGVKKAGMEAALPMISLVGGQVYKALGEKMGIEEEPVDETLARIAEKIYADPKLRKTVIEALSEEDQARLAIALQELERRKQRDKIKRNWSAATRGVNRPMPTGVLRDLTDAQIKAVNEKE